MDWFVKAFIRASLAWFPFGIMMGLVIAVYPPWVAVAHWWLANLGLAGMVTGFFLQPHIGVWSAPVTATGSLPFALGALGFVYNMWRTFDKADARARERALRRIERALPTIE